MALWHRRRQRVDPTSAEESALLINLSGKTALPAVDPASSGTIAHFASHGFTPLGVAWRSSVLAVLYVASSYLWFIGLPLTSVGEATVIFNVSICFTYLLSVLFLRERVTAAKNLALVVAGIGIALIFMSSSHASHGQHHTAFERVLGDAMVLLAGFISATFEVSYKMLCTPAEARDSSLLLSALWTGGFGLATCAFLWIPVPILSQTGVETFMMPRPGSKLFLMWCLELLSAFAYNVGYIMALALTPSPLYVTAAILLTIPASMLTDYALLGTSMAPLALAGSACIAVGWVILVIGGHFESAKQDTVEVIQ